MEEVEGPRGGERARTTVSQAEAELCPGLMFVDELAVIAPAAELVGLTVSLERLTHHQQPVLWEPDIARPGSHWSSSTLLRSQWSRGS